MPTSTMNVAFSSKTVGDVSLPWGWEWSDEDKNNYENVQKKIYITRGACEHAWDAGEIAIKPTALKNGVRTYNTVRIRKC